ncbi:unnamed protein product [Amoebophrya sp. A25]|nr:unnamed protein product [Amoebophrya sp. A25]|eukprot:GSA25T00007516001.1
MYTRWMLNIRIPQVPPHPGDESNLFRHAIHCEPMKATFPQLYRFSRSSKTPLANVFAAGTNYITTGNHTSSSYNHATDDDVTSEVLQNDGQFYHAFQTFVSENPEVLPYLGLFSEEYFRISRLYSRVNDKLVHGTAASDPVAMAVLRPFLLGSSSTTVDASTSQHNEAHVDLRMRIDDHLDPLPPFLKGITFDAHGKLSAEVRESLKSNRTFTKAQVTAFLERFAAGQDGTIDFCEMARESVHRHYGGDLEADEAFQDEPVSRQDSSPYEDADASEQAITEKLTSALRLFRFVFHLDDSALSAQLAFADLKEILNIGSISTDEAATFCISRLRDALCSLRVGAVLLPAYDSGHGDLEERAASTSELLITVPDTYLHEKLLFVSEGEGAPVLPSQERCRWQSANPAFSGRG